MQKCPNCGQTAERTEDWACQWCGYPLLSKSYTKIPKTYRQLKGEEPPEPGLEPEPESAVPPEPTPAAVVPEPTVAPEPVVEPVSAAPEPTPAVAPEPTAAPEPTPAVAPEPTAAPESVATPEPAPAIVPEPTAAPESVATPEPAPAIVPEPTAAPESVAAPEPAPAPEPVAEPTPEPESAAAPEPTVAPEPVVEPVSVAPEPTPAPEPLSAARGITVEQLYSAYSADEAAEDAKFTDKTLTVTGVVDRITVNDLHGIYYIILAGAEKKEQWNVRCTFDRKYGAQLSRLAVGQTVTVRGKYDGYKANILMKDCVLPS